MNVLSREFCHSVKGHAVRNHVPITERSHLTALGKRIKSRRGWKEETREELVMGS